MILQKLKKKIGQGVVSNHIKYLKFTTTLPTIKLKNLKTNMKKLLFIFNHTMKIKTESLLLKK